MKRENIMISTILEIENAVSGDWLSGGGECCGFDAYVNGEKVIFCDRICGHGIAWEGEMPLSDLKKVARKLDIDALAFEQNEATVKINNEVEFIFDENEMGIIPGIFNMRKRLSEGN